MLEIAKTMYLLHHNDLPTVLNNSFTKLKSIHSHETRQLGKNVDFLPRLNKSFAKNLLAFKENLELHKSHNQKHSWVSLKKKFKLKLLDNYNC